MLISRFLLNLRSVSEPQGQSAFPSSPSQFTAPEFRFPTIAEVVDNMGQDLHQRPDNTDRDSVNSLDTPAAATASTSTPASGLEAELQLEYAIQVTPRTLDV